MPRENFRRPRRRTKEERGHKPTCEFTNNHGPPCNCDGLEVESVDSRATRAQIDQAMAFGGWTSEGGDSRCYVRRFGVHRVTIARVNSGWSIVWMRGMGLTIFEERCGFGTVQMALTVFWEHVIERYDQQDEVITESVKSVPKGEEG
jgi:hypothetical protein